MAIREHGGNRETAWGKVEAEGGTIAEVQGDALLALGALADKVDGKNKVGQLAKATQEIMDDVEVWLAVLVRCFQLQDELDVLEIDHVLDVAPADLDRHRLGLSAAQQERRELIVGATTHLLDRMDQAGAVANSNVLLHRRKVGEVVDSVNSAHVIVDEFHAPLGIETARGSMEATRWRDAVRDPTQLKNAGVEAGVKVGVGATALALTATAAKFGRRSDG
jgi:hypothetical protein